MEVSRPKYISHGRAVSTGTRKTWGNGWLRLVVQTIFAIITVTSFILIVFMAIRTPKPGPVVRPTVSLRCHLQGCSVICEEAPYFEKYEEDIIFAVTDAETKCRRVYLELHKPSFTNDSLPLNWLSKIRNEVSHLSIIGGNLMHIPTGAFMSQFAAVITTIELKDIRIKTLAPDSLVGLSRLRIFNILNSWIDNAEANALRAIDDTLETLTITESGDWDPFHFTGFRGFEKLTLVDFSYNDFNNILNKYSFLGLEMTKILYLNYCRITSIGPGTFDHLTGIEVLYLNNNMLSTVPPGLFDTIVPLNDPRPRINLKENYWFCDCSVDDLRQLVRKDILLVEVKCTYPKEFESMTFTEFDYTCNSNSTTNAMNYSNNMSNLLDMNKNQFYPEPLYINGSSCKNGTFKLISAVRNNVCSSKKFQYLDLTRVVDRNLETVQQAKWLRFSNFVATKNYTTVQIGALKEQNNFGLLWYQSTCPYEIFCLDVIPTYLQVYNKNRNARYRFCPIHIKNASVDNEECIDIFASKTELPQNNITPFGISLYIFTIFTCFSFGALIVYGMIIRKPTLLKGSKRVIFVKHKNVEALVLPPKIPQRKDLTNFSDNNIFTLTSGNDDKFKLPNVKRIKSIKSNKTPSYIFPMQPTDDQLAEWRIRHHFNNDLTISSRMSELSTLSWIDTTYYYSLDDSDRTYESLK